MATLALVGAAHIHTPNFVKKMASREDVTVKSVWDHDAARAAKSAEQLGAQVAELGAIWSDPAIEAVVVCSETNRHEELVTPAAGAAKHLFVEKPLGMGAADANRMAEAIEQAGVLFQTGYFRRGEPVTQFIRQQVQAGAFGQLTRLRLCNCHSGSLGGWFDTDWRWMADPAIAGCGAFGDLGTHVLDLLLWWLGEVDACTASIRSVTGRYGDCDETGEGLLRFKDGVLATLTGSWVDVANPIPLEVCGTEGHAWSAGGQFFFQSQHVDGADGKSPWTDLPPARPHAFDLFLDAVTGQAGLPLVTAREAAYRSAVMEALYQAAAQNTWVKP